MKKEQLYVACGIGGENEFEEYAGFKYKNPGLCEIYTTGLLSIDDTPRG